jgi:hypothetical protein
MMISDDYDFPPAPKREAFAMCLVAALVLAIVGWACGASHSWAWAPSLPVTISPTTERRPTASSPARQYLPAGRRGGHAVMTGEINSPHASQSSPWRL